MIYDLNKKDIDDEKLLKELLSIISKLFIKKSIKKLINNFIIKSNIVLKIKNLYKKIKTFQRIIYTKNIE